MYARLRIHGAVRYLWPDGNPLRRTVDHARSAAAGVLAAAFLVSAPLMGISTAEHTYAAQARAARWERLTRHSVDAGIRKVSADSASALGTGTSSMSTVRWRTRDGMTRTGVVIKSAGDRVGGRRTVWVDRSGALTRPPRTYLQVVTLTVVVPALCVSALAVILGGTWLLIRGRLDRRGHDHWDREWLTVAPRWTGRT